MNGKLKRLSFTIALALLSTLAAGCSLQGKAEAEKTVVINENIQFESALEDSNLQVTRQDDIKVKAAIPPGGMFKGEKIYYNENNAFYSFDGKTGKQKLLVDKEVFELSESANYVLSYEGRTSKEQKVSVHNLQNGKTSLITHVLPSNIDHIDYGFINAEGNGIASFDYSTNMLTLEDIEKNEITEWDMKGFEDVWPSHTKKIGNDVFFIARSEKDGYGVYQLADKGSIKNIASIPGEDTNISAFDVLRSNTAIFSGTADGKPGIFLLDLATNHLEQLVSGGETSEGIWIPSYKLSPDESKMMFGTSVQVGDEFKSNIYMAELIEGKLANSVRIVENLQSYSVISLSGAWHKDSKTAYIEQWLKGSEVIDSVAVFEVE